MDRSEPLGGGATLALLESLYASAPVGLGFWDTELRFRRVNARLAEMNGLPPEAHVGHTLRELFGEAGADGEEALREVLGTGRPLLDREFAGRTVQQGPVRRWRASFYPVRGPAGEPLGVGVVVIEITEEHAAAAREREALRQAEAARLRAETLARASAALSSSMRIDTILEGLVRAAVPAVGDWCSIHLARPGGPPELIAVAHSDPAREPLAWELNQRYPADPEAPTGAPNVIRTGRREVLAEIPDELLETAAVDAEHLRLIRALRLRSAAVLPLTARGAVLGALTVVMAESGRTYEPELVELAESLAAGAGLALDNARLYAEQVEVARALQRTLLPSTLPAVPGAQLAARYRAAGRSNEVGGDFYDVFEAAGGGWTFLIGDVVGKGAEAAAITSLVRATLQAAALRGDGPGDGLRLVDEALRRRGTGLRFCTAVHGCLRTAPEGGLDVDLLNAGHPPPLVLRRDGELEVVEASGTLLGVVAEPRFGEAALRLAPGDTLLLYTDGATELKGPDPWRGEAALRDTLRRSAGVPLPELVERIEHQALVQSGGELRDDLALLAVRAAPGTP